MQVTLLRIGNIVPGKNPRTYFDPTEMQELEESIRTKGVMQPILVRPLATDIHQIIAGERRWRASQNVLGLDGQIPVFVREMDDDEAEEAALIENVQRANMSPTEEAEAAAKVLGRCNGDREEAARRLGWSRTTLDKRLALMNCSEAVRSALTERKIQLGHAELLAAVTRDKQDKALAKLLSSPSIMPVAQFKAQLAQIAKSLASAIFDKTGCAGCPNNSSTQQALFGEAIDAGQCTHGPCFDTKTTAVIETLKSELAENFPRVEVVTPGDDFTHIKLVAQGETGVGDEQAKECRACANFGAAISNVPGSIGTVHREHCFDVACHTKKVATRIKAEKEAKSTNQATSKHTATNKTSKQEKPTTATKAQDTQRVKDYRVSVWRQALRSELMLQPERNLTVLIAIGMAGLAHYITRSKLLDVYEKADGKKHSTSTVDFLAASIEKADGAVREEMHLSLAACVAEGVDESNLVRLLKYMNVDLAKHWKLCDDFLKLLTRSEVDALAEEIDLKTALAGDYAKTLALKKDEMVKKMLAVPGFAYEGQIPRCMRYGNK